MFIRDDIFIQTVINFRMPILDKDFLQNAPVHFCYKDFAPRMFLIVNRDKNLDKIR